MERKTDPAPALTRGLRLLEMLALDGQSSLEQLAAKTGWPKSSTRRYLQALQIAGAATRDPHSLRWEATRHLTPTIPRNDAWAHARAALAPLAEVSSCCAELYTARGGHVALADRAEPESSEVHLAARIGFERDLTELEATSIIYFAWQSEAKPHRRLWRWSSGQRQSVRAAERNAILHQARANALATDHDFNENGIRRFAAPLLNCAGQLAGIIAVAQRQTPRAADDTEAIRAAVAHAIKQIHPLPL